METKIKTTIESTFGSSDNLNQNQFSSELTANSDNGEGTFQLKMVEQKQITLGNANTFDENILNLLQTPIPDITFIHIECKTVESEGVLSVPVPFKVKFSNTYALQTSSLTFSDIRDIVISTLNVYDVTVEEDKTACLVIIVGSKNENNS